jgi:predicted dehydrogenase
MGAEMLRVAFDHPDFVVSQACDVNVTTLARARAIHSSVAFSTDPHSLVESPTLDAIYLAVPPAHHAELAVAAMRSGKAVLCEKPLAISLTDGRRMLDAAAESQVASGVNFALSDRHATLEIERQLASGEVGEVVGVDIRFQLPRWPRDFQSGATWLAGRAQGGFVREVLSHFAYLTDRLLGPLEVVDVSVDYPAEPAAASEYAARGSFRSGDVPIHFSGYSMMAAVESYEWILWGTRRSYLLRDWDQLFISDGDGWLPAGLDGERGSEATRLALFAQAMRGQRSRNLADFASGFRVQQVVEAFHDTEHV